MVQLSNVSVLKSGLVRFELDLGPLMDKLNSIPDAVRNKMVRGGLRYCLVPTMIAAKALAPTDSGRLRDNIGIRAGRSRGTKIVVLVSARERGRRGSANDTYYGYFQEKGWKSYRSQQQVPGKHYMERAFEQTEAAFTASVEAFLSEAVRQYFA